MKKLINDDRLMIKVCDLYYNEDMTHREIAQQLGVSRPTISRLLAQARQQQVVRITIPRLAAVKHWSLEQQLKERYSLRDAVVVDTLHTLPEQNHLLGKTAASYLEHTVCPGDTVGVSMGSTLYHTAYAPVEHPVQGITFVPLIGGMGQLRTELHSNHLAERLAKAYGGRFYPLYAPARVSNPLVRQELMREESVAQVLQWQKNLTVALVGIGYPNERSSIQATGYYKNNEMRELMQRGVVGDICMQFYDAAGDTAPYRKDNQVIGVELRRLRRVPCSVGVAGGRDKLPAIRGAIAGGYINVLITDRDCAVCLLEEIGKDEPHE